MKVRFIRDYGNPVKYKTGQEVELKDKEAKKISGRFYVVLKEPKKKQIKGSRNTAMKSKEVKNK